MSDKLDFWLNKLNDAESFVLEPNFKAAKRHIRQMESNGTSKRTIISHIEVLVPFLKWLKKDITLLDEDDIFDYDDILRHKKYKRGKKEYEYSDLTVYHHRSVIKTFLKPVNKAAFGAITLKRVKRELPEILTAEDVDAMIKHALSARDRALLACLYESGARKGELLSVKIRHLTFDENGVIMVLPQGKTGSRRIRLVYSAAYLREWVSVHPAGDNRESIVFCSLRSPYNAISVSGLLYQLRGLAARAGVSKRVNPHSFRHAAATHLAQHLTEQELKIYLGWTQASSMAAIYVHLAGKDIDNAILRMNGLQEEQKENAFAVTRCPRCKELLPEKSTYCNKCGLPIQDSFSKKLETDKAEIDLEIIKAVLQDSRILDEISKRMSQNE